MFLFEPQGTSKTTWVNTWPVRAGLLEPQGTSKTTWVNTWPVRAGAVCSRQPVPCDTCPSRTVPRQPVPCGTGPSKVFFFVALSFFSLFAFGQRGGAPPLSDAPQEDWPCVAFGSSFGPGGVPAPIAPENLWFPDPANPYDGQGALGHICSRQPAPCGTCPSRTDPRQPAPCGTGPSKVVTLVIVDLRGKAPFGTFPLRAMTISPVFDRSVPDSLCLAAPARREPTPDSLHLAALARRRFCFVLLFCLVLLFF